MDEYTLISFIGKSEYKLTPYQFPNDDATYETSVFVTAILKSKYKLIKKVILVGTFTSNWDFLVDKDNNADFYQKLNAECNSNGISEKSKEELESRLQEWYNIPFKIIDHTKKISSDTIEDIFFIYKKIPGLLADNTHILLDITHALRSMPLLVYQSLQLNINLQNIFDRKIELIYGELKEKEISPVHDLSKYWDYYEISSAVKLFDEKLDGKLLAQKIRKYWEDGADFLLLLCEIVECNFSLRVHSAVKQLKSIIDEYEKTESENPSWVTGVKDKLLVIHERLNVEENEKCHVAKTVWEYSNLLQDKKLFTQAIIAKQVAIETAITECINRSKIGDYKWFRHDKSNKSKMPPIEQLRTIRQSFHELTKPLELLEETRNYIAHGGSISNQGHIVLMANVQSTLDSVDIAIRDFFTRLERRKHA
jgi:CRISPR-associated Csx2 family protein